MQITNQHAKTILVTNFLTSDSVKTIRLPNGDIEEVMDTDITAGVFTYFGIFDPNETSQAVLKELIVMGNPLADPDMAIANAKQDVNLLLQIRGWVKDGLNRKVDTACGVQPE